MDEEREPERRSRWVAIGLSFAFLLAVILLLVGWNRVAHSSRLCAQCHVMVNDVASAERSVHSELSCLDCHTRPGLAGSLRYIPTLARETVANVTGWGVAHGVLDARPCESCHTNLTTNPALKPAHEGQTACSSCHGDVTHPPLQILTERPSPLTYPHPEGWTTTHGTQIAQDPGACATCHRPIFCQACHFKTVFPHPEDWISQHGIEQEKQGPQACTLCHPSTFCVGCHGTEIPHQSDWLGEHWRALQDAPVTPCLLCHPKTDCTTCHSEHGVHTSQDLYVGGSS